MIKKTFAFLTHPIVIFVLLQIIWIAVLILWVAGFQGLASTIRPTEGSMLMNQIIIIAGCILLGLILIGTVMLFIFIQKQASFLRKQKSFVSSVTHELKSPLASLQLSFETLQKPKLPGNVEENINQMIHQDIQRLNLLVDRVLVSARLEQGIFEIEKPKAGDDTCMKQLFTNLVKQACHLDATLEERTTVSIDPKICSHLPKLALALIFGNIIENAAKYSSGSSPIEIKAIESNRHYVFIIKDRGYGISPKDKRKIFKMFYRSELASKKAIKGTGLGLYISRSTARLLKGDITVESRGIGHGTTFSVTLPKPQKKNAAAYKEVR